MCTRGSGFCGAENGKHFKFEDCDGDGVVDPMCTENGQIWAIKSSEECTKDGPKAQCVPTNLPSGKCF